MTIAAYPLRARVGLAMGAMALRERPRFGGQSDATVRTAWFFGVAAPAEYELDVTLAGVSLSSTLDVAAPVSLRFRGGRLRGRVRF